MRPRIYHLACLLILLVSACGNEPPKIALEDTPTTINLLYVPTDATSTATPFQPIVATDITQPSPVNTETPTPLEITATPQTFYVPPYAPDPVPVLPSEGTVTFLLLGSDRRPGQIYFRTDTLIIVILRPGNGQVSLVSVPRDLYVYIPSMGMDRVNTAYEYGEMKRYAGGGFALLKETLLYNLGLQINNLAIADFNGFRHIVDTLGGVDVYVKTTFTDARSGFPDGYTLESGIVHMDGELALWYIRARKTTSDLDRLRRAQEVLVAVGYKLLSLNAFKNIPDLYASYRRMIITDMTLTDLVQLTPLTLHLNNTDIRNYYIGRGYVTSWRTTGGASVLVPNIPAIQQLLIQAIGTP